MCLEIKSSLAAIQRQDQVQDFLSIVSDPAIERSIQACKTRTILTKQQVLEIFMVRLVNDSSETGERVGARLLAEQYRVNEKTIRDIWSGRTWYRETLHLDPRRKLDPNRLKAPGRPRGLGTLILRERSLAHKKSATERERERQDVHDATVGGMWNNAQGHFAGVMEVFKERIACCDGVKAMCFESLQPAGQDIHHELHEAYQNLPISSSAEDPFHDDWPHWSRDFSCNIFESPSSTGCGF
jgi:hypothetical protein